MKIYINKLPHTHYPKKVDKKYVTINLILITYYHTCKVDSISLQAVIMADGNHTACQHRVKDFSWQLRGSTFTTEALLINLGICDMVLGVQWLSTLGKINWDFKRLIIEFFF